MKKSTTFKSDMSDNNNPLIEKEHKTLPSSPKKETISNIMAFAKSYSVRKGKAFDKMEFMLN